MGIQYKTLAKSKHVKPPAVVGGETREQLKVAFVVVFKWAL